MLLYAVINTVTRQICRKEGAYWKGMCIWSRKIYATNWLHLKSDKNLPLVVVAIDLEKSVVIERFNPEYRAKKELADKISNLKTKIANAKENIAWYAERIEEKSSRDAIAHNVSALASAKTELAKLL